MAATEITVHPRTGEFSLTLTPSNSALTQGALINVEEYEGPVLWQIHLGDAGSLDAMALQQAAVRGGTMRTIYSGSDWTTASTKVPLISHTGGVFVQTGGMIQIQTEVGGAAQMALLIQQHTKETTEMIIDGRVQKKHGPSLY